MAIRWKEGELDDLRREIERYNRKIAKLAKKGYDPGMGSLPERAKLRTAKAFRSRSELNAYKKSMERFLKKGSEELIKTKGGVVIPKFERDEINALNARINARRRKTAKTVAAARAAGDLPLMGRIKDNTAKPRRGLNKVTPWDYKKYKEVAQFEGDVNYIAKRERMYRLNYYKMIDHLYTPKDARKIKRRLSKISDHELVTKTIDMEDISISIASPPATGRDSVIVRMTEGFKKAFPDEFNTFELEEEPEPDLELDEEDYE